MQTKMPDALPIHVTLDGEPDPVSVDPATGDIMVPDGDGGTVVHLNSARKAANDDDVDPWFANLAEDMKGERITAGFGGISRVGDLTVIAEELIEQIDADDQSRQGYLANVSQGLVLLGTKLEKPKSVASESASGVEGMSQVTNPLLLDAMLRGWANTVGELLPAEGPAKVKDVGDASAQADELAEALERDFNHYLTDIATEYYPDHSHMILWGPYFKGCGIVKVYRCPMRRRPVAESVDVKDFIVSDASKDLRSCGRITHQIMMRPSVMRRMMLLKVYVKYDLAQASPQTNRVDQKIAAIQGVDVLPKRPEDQPYTVWESQCELDLPEYAQGKFKDEGIPLPYRVTIDKDARKILALHRDWNEDDEDAQRKRLYVRYPYVPGPGFYGTGLLNILGNSSAAMTAAWREALDAGMYASFPAGLGEKSAMRQNTNMFRLSPGEFAPVETSGKDIRSLFMGMPYHDVTSGLMGLMDRITTQSEKLGGAANIPTAEGIQNVPVGTMLAQIEQATKVMAAAHKGMHQAQSEELQMLRDLFRENPEDFWRGNTVAPDGYWNEEKFLRALDAYPLEPVSDPNVPSHIHRIAKALGLVQLKTNPAFAPFMDTKTTLSRILSAMKEDQNGLLIDPPPQQAQPDPNMLAAFARYLSAQASMTSSQAKAQESQQKMALEPEKLQTQREIAASELQREMIIHGTDQAKAIHTAAMDRAQHGLNVLKTVHELAESGRQHGLDTAQAAHEHGLERAQHALDVHQVLNPQPPSAAGAGPKK